MLGPVIVIALGALLMIGGGIWYVVARQKAPAMAHAAPQASAAAPPQAIPPAPPPVDNTITGGVAPQAAPLLQNGPEADKSKTSRLVINCRNGVMPTVQMKASERLYALSLPQAPRQGLGFMEYFTMKDGGEVRFNADGKPPPSAFACVVDNFGDHAFAKVKVSFHINSWNVIKTGDSSKAGDFAFKTSGFVEIPVLPQGQSAFTFYIMNMGTLYHEFSIDEVADGVGVNTGKVEKLGVISIPAQLFSWPQQF